MAPGATPRFGRVPRRRVRLTERDLQVVMAVYEARYLSGRQIGRLLFGREGSSQARQRLRYLFDLDYLRKRTAGPNEPDTYYLGLAGRRYVAAQGLCTRAEADKLAGVSGEGAATPALMMAHELALGELYVRAWLECQQQGWGLAWKSVRALEREKLGLQPDGWLAVHANATGEQDPQQAFLEYTAVMPSAAEMRDKLSRYQAYWEHTRNAAAVLWLTTSQSQVEGLLRAIGKSAYRDCYLVGWMEEAQEYLAAPIWRWGEARDPGHRVSWMQAQGPRTRS